MKLERRRPEDREGLQSLLDFIKLSRNMDFTGYKRSSLTRRINKRMAAVNVNTYNEYQDYLQVHPDEFPELFNTILINVTRFFRDPPAWEFFATEVLPKLLERRDEGQDFRVWSVGCSSGQEAYTLVMILAEAMGKERFIQHVKIYATDIDAEAITAARDAVYSAQDLEDVPELLRQKYFQPVNGKYQFTKDLRRSVIFGVHDVVQGAPISRLDVLVCRNTLMYFNSDLQAKVLARFHFALNDLGILFLGMAETMIAHDRYFGPLNQKYRIFQKLHVSGRNHFLMYPEAGAERPGAGRQTYEALFQYPPPRKWW